MKKNNHSNLFKMLSGKQLQPYINYIRFPCYKNLEPGLKVTFDYPLTAIVGQNGTNKSSLLRAIYGCPDGYNLGNFWFSTDIDQINDSNGRPRFIYSYFQPDAKRDVEIIKTRIKRSYSNDKGKINPDYWEPSRPLTSDGMEKMPDINKGMDGRFKTRWKIMEKDVLFIDFRSLESAFDKCFYHGDIRKTLATNSKQEYIRKKSRRLKKAIDNNLQSQRLYKNQREFILKNILLFQEQVKYISEILGREYTEIRIIRHRFFMVEGASVLLKSEGLEYSEAFAGSGEFSVTLLVYQVFMAKDKSLIILDEPEVSLHPGAQEKLVQFLHERIVLNKHQVVLGTHSPFILNKLPDQAVKTLYLDSVSHVIKVINKTHPEEAFFHLGIRDKSKKTIFVEDRLAREVVLKALKVLGQPMYEAYTVSYLPSGADALLQEYLPIYAMTERVDTLFALDSDKCPKVKLDNDDKYQNIADENLDEIICDVLGGPLKIPVDGSKGGGNKEQFRDAKITVLEYCRKYIAYIPGNTPEEFIWKNMKFDTQRYRIDFNAIENYKKRFVKLCTSELGKEEYEDIEADEIFHLQKRCLATVDNKQLNQLVETIRLHK